MKTYTIFILIIFGIFSSAGINTMEKQNNQPSGEAPGEPKASPASWVIISEERSEEQQRLDHMLISAILANDIETTKEALAKGARANAHGALPHETGSFPAIILAATMPDALELIELLVDYGADINAPSPSTINHPFHLGDTAVFVFIKSNLGLAIQPLELAQFMMLGAQLNLPYLKVGTYPLEVLRWLFEHGFTPSASSRLILAMRAYTDEKLLLSYITARRNKEALRLLEELLQKAHHHKLSEEDKQLLRQAFFLAIAQRNYNVFNFILGNFTHIVNLPAGFARAALVGNIKAMQNVYDAVKDVSQNIDFDRTGIFDRALAYALAQRRYNQVRWLLSTALDENIAVNLTALTHSLNRRLSALEHIINQQPRSAEESVARLKAIEEQEELQVLVNDIYSIGAERLLSPNVLGLDASQITAQLQRLSPELFAIIMAMLLQPLREAGAKS